MQSSSYWRHQQRPLRRPAEALTREVYSGPQERLGSRLTVLTRKRLLSFTQGVCIVILFALVTCGISFWHVFWMPQGRAQYLNCLFIKSNLTLALLLPLKFVLLIYVQLRPVSVFSIYKYGHRCIGPFGVCSFSPIIPVPCCWPKSIAPLRAFKYVRSHC